MRDWLLFLRKKQELSQQEVAERCGISRQYYGLIEQGKRNVSVKIAKAIASVFGFDWRRFF